MSASNAVHFNSSRQRIYCTKNNGIICSPIPTDGFVITDEDAPHTAFAVAPHVHPEMYVWHDKLGHLGFDS